MVPVYACVRRKCNIYHALLLMRICESQMTNHLSGVGDYS